jgi:hypothetical protein
MQPAAPARRPPFAQRLRLRQEWRRRADTRVYWIDQLHRKDALAELRHCDGERLFVTFKDLREKWEQIA